MFRNLRFNNFCFVVIKKSEVFKFLNKLKMSQKHEKVEDPSDPFFIRTPPPPFKLSTFLYNSKEGTILGRTGSSWGKKFFFSIFKYSFKGCLVFMVKLF